MVVLLPARRRGPVLSPRKNPAMNRPRLPVVYSCSGCSNVAQAANRLAVQLDRRGEAVMSCIAGVGAGVPSLVRIAQDAGAILAIDGCPLACCMHALERAGVSPTIHVDLSKHGCRKRHHEDFDDTAIVDMMERIVRPALERCLSAGHQQESGNPSPERSP